MKKVISIIFVLALVIGIGYAVYLNTGPIVHESLVLKGETLRVGNMILMCPEKTGHEILLERGSNHEKATLRLRV